MPDNESGLSCLQSACVKGDTETVYAILNNSPDKLDSAIALSLKTGENVSRFNSQSILTGLGALDSENHKQISNLVEKVAKDFQSQPLLHIAAKKGNIEHIRRLLDFGEFVDCAPPDKSGETPLMWAARYNVEEIVQFLVEKGASLEIQDGNGYTPLHHAAMGGKEANILRLIKLGADILKESYRHYSPVHLACIDGHKEAVRLLLGHGAEASREGGFMVGSPFTSAARNGHLEIVQLLVESGVPVNKRSVVGWSALHEAVAGGHIHVVKYLLEKGADIQAITTYTRKGKEYHQSVLHLATSPEMFRLLIEYGADINALEDFQYPTLHVAAKLGHNDIVDYLLNQGVNVNLRTDHSRLSALTCAIKGDQDATVKHLIERGCSVDYCDSCLSTLAVGKGFIAVFELLLNRGISVDTMDKNGKTPLIAAAEAGQADMVEFLLDRGASINGTRDEFKKLNDEGYASQDKHKSSFPLYHALKAGHIEVAQRLIRRGADTVNFKEEIDRLGSADFVKTTRLKSAAERGEGCGCKSKE